MALPLSSSGRGGNGAQSSSPGDDRALLRIQHILQKK
jgi:hypothetical protein